MEEIQRTLITIIFLYPKERYLIFRRLDERYFVGQYRTIFKECKKLYLEKKEIDPVVVVALIGSEYLNTVAALSDMSLLIKPNTEEYIDLLKDDYNKIKL